MMKPLSTKKKSTAMYPCGTSDGIGTLEWDCAVAEKCCITTAIAAKPRRDVSERSSAPALAPVEGAAKVQTKAMLLPSNEVMTEK